MLYRAWCRCHGCVLAGRSAGTARWPATAVAAATAGATRCVRAPAPCLPSKFLFDVDALRCPARIRSHTQTHGARCVRILAGEHFAQVPLTGDEQVLEALAA